MSDSPDFSSFDGICAWFDEHALNKIQEEYDEDFLTFGIAFIAIEDGKILPEVAPVPVIADSDLSDESFQRDYADQFRTLLKQKAATGVAMIVRVRGEDEDELDAVIVALEHKGGRAAWMASEGETGLEKFRRDDTISWKPGHAFADLMPVRSMN